MLGADTSDVDSRETDVGGVGLPRRVSPTDLSALLHRDTSAWRLARPVVLALLIVIGIGGLLGFGAFRLIGGSQGWPVNVTRTANGWRLSSPEGFDRGSIALTDNYLAYDNGDSLELLDLRSGKTKVLARGRSRRAERPTIRSLSSRI